MKSFQFQDNLVVNTFAGDNIYRTRHQVDTEYSFTGHDNHELFISRGGMISDLCIKVSLEINFNDRVLTNAKIDEILDTAKIPIRLKIKDKIFYIGKGLIISQETGLSNFRVLFAATTPKNPTSPIRQKNIRFYIDKAAVKDENYSPIRTILKELISQHPGEILYTENMDRYFHRFEFIPSGFGTLSSINTYKANLLTKAIHMVSEELKQKQTAG